MKIILSREDIEEIIKKIFDIEAIGWNEDGTLTIDTMLEKLVNDKSKFNTDDLRKMLGRPVVPTPNPYNPPYNPTPYNPPLYPTPKPIWYGIGGGITTNQLSPGQTTITNVTPSQTQGTLSSGFVSSIPLKPKKDSK